MSKFKTKKNNNELIGKLIHKGSIYDVFCNSKNHYLVSNFGTLVQCGCFCKKSKFKKNGFTKDLLKTPTVNDGVKIEKTATMEWLEKIGVL